MERRRTPSHTYTKLTAGRSRFGPSYVDGTQTLHADAMHDPRRAPRPAPAAPMSIYVDSVPVLVRYNDRRRSLGHEGRGGRSSSMRPSPVVRPPVRCVPGHATSLVAPSSVRPTLSTPPPMARRICTSTPSGRVNIVPPPAASTSCRIVRGRWRQCASVSRRPCWVLAATASVGIAITGRHPVAISGAPSAPLGTHRRPIEFRRKPRGWQASAPTCHRAGTLLLLSARRDRRRVRERELFSPVVVTGGRRALSGDPFMGGASVSGRGDWTAFTWPPNKAQGDGMLCGCSLEMVVGVDVADSRAGGLLRARLRRGVVFDFVLFLFYDDTRHGAAVVWHGQIEEALFSRIRSSIFCGQSWWPPHYNTG